MSLKEWVSSQVFSLVHSNNLVYNTCWEDPRLDRSDADAEYGGEVPELQVRRPSLEDIYLELIGSTPAVTPELEGTAA